MRLLAIDIGGLTQDILLFDSSQSIENCVKMVMPSPTTIVANKIRTATRAKRAIFITGVNMGGGFSRQALVDHLKSGIAAYATVGAAATFDDNIDEVGRLGVTIVPEGSTSTKNQKIIKTKDIDLASIKKILAAFDVETDFDGIAIAVFDHGAAPPGVSDRVFRFQHLHQVISNKKDLNAFAYLANEIPPALTRMKAVAKSIPKNIPLLVMDTPIAAAIGSLEDKEVGLQAHKVVMNVGNFHTLAFHLQNDSILGFFEHHTHSLTRNKMENLVTKLVKGILTNEEVFNDGGHGCLILESRKDIPFISVTGPRRSLMSGSRLKPYFATPYGDMMLTGCFGLVRAFARRVKTWQEEIEMALDRSK